MLPITKLRRSEMICAVWFCALRRGVVSGSFGIMLLLLEVQNLELAFDPEEEVTISACLIWF